MTAANAGGHSARLRSFSDLAARDGVLLLACAVAAGLSIICGCVSSRPSQNRQIHIAVNSSGVISVAGKPCRLSVVSRKLKSLGATPQTPIAIALPPSGGDDVMKALTRELVSGGFRHFVFVRPREIDASASSHQKRQQSIKHAP